MSENPSIIEKLIKQFLDASDQDENESTFVGREKEKQYFGKVLEGGKTRIVQCYGLQEVGKSRLILKVAMVLNSKEIEVLYDNFASDENSILSDVMLNNKLDEITTADQFNQFVSAIKERCKKTVIFLDNIEGFTQDRLQKDKLQKFITTLTKKCSKLWVVFTTTQQIHFTEKYFVEKEVHCLTPEDSLQLLRSVIRERADNMYEGENTANEDYVYECAIVTLLGGLPKAIILTGSELADSILTFPDTVELLLSHLSDMLTREEYGASDRVGDTFMALARQTSRHEDALNKMIPGKTFTVDESLKASADENESKAVHKLKTLIPLLRRCLVGRAADDDKETFTLHIFLRHYIAVKQSDEETRVKVMKYMAENIGLDPSENLLDSRTLAKLVARLGETRKSDGKEEGGKSDDSGTCDDLDSQEEEHFPDISMENSEERFEERHQENTERLNNLSIDPPFRDEYVSENEFGRLRLPNSTRYIHSTDSSDFEETRDIVDNLSSGSHMTSLSGPAGIKNASYHRINSSSPTNSEATCNLGSIYPKEEPMIEYADYNSTSAVSSSGSLRPRGPPFVSEDEKILNVNSNPRQNCVNGIEQQQKNRQLNHSICAASDGRSSFPPRDPPFKRYSPPLSASPPLDSSSSPQGRVSETSTSPCYYFIPQHPTSQRSPALSPRRSPQSPSDGNVIRLCSMCSSSNASPAQCRPKVSENTSSRRAAATHCDTPHCGLPRQPSEHDDIVQENLDTGVEKVVTKNKMFKKSR